MRKRWLAGFGAASVLILGFLAISKGIDSARRHRGMSPPLLTVQYSPEPTQWRGANKEPVSVAHVPRSAAVADPMEDVDAFLRRNRKEVDDSINALTREAESLRARLRKVEAALGRWQDVSKAIQQQPMPAPAGAEVPMPQGDPPAAQPIPTIEPPPTAEPAAPPTPTAPAPEEPFLLPAPTLPMPVVEVPKTPAPAPPDSGPALPPQDLLPPPQ